MVITSFKEKHQLVNNYVEEKKDIFHDYENLGVNNLAVFKETLVDFLEELESNAYDIDEDGLCPGQVTDDLLGDPDDSKNFNMLQAQKIVLTYMPWEKYLKQYGRDLRNISKFYEDYFYNDILNVYDVYNEKYGKNETLQGMKEKFTITVPLNKVQNCYKRSKDGTMTKCYGIKLKDNEETTRILLLPSKTLIEPTNYSDRMVFEIKKGMRFDITDGKKVLDDTLSSEDIKSLTENCDFYLDKLKQSKNNINTKDEGGMDND